MHDALMNRIKELRRARGLSQKELGDMAGLDHSFISRAERGESELGANSLLAIAAALGVTVEELTGEPSRRSRLDDLVSRVPPALQDDVADMLERFLSALQKQPK